MLTMHLSGRAQTKMFQRSADRFLVNLDRWHRGEPGRAADGPRARILRLPRGQVTDGPRFVSKRGGIPPAVAFRGFARRFRRAGPVGGCASGRRQAESVRPVHPLPRGRGLRIHLRRSGRGKPRLSRLALPLEDQADFDAARAGRGLHGQLPMGGIRAGPACASPRWGRARPISSPPPPMRSLAECPC